MIQSYEVVILLRTLKNVNLETKGIYRLKLMMQIDCTNPPSVFDISHPYILFKSNTKLARQWVSGKPTIANKTFISEHMQMKFVGTFRLNTDQQITLMDVIGYKVDITSTCCVTLICELEKQELVNNKKTSTTYESRVKIRSIKQGICEYIEIPFKQNQQITLSLCLFSILAGSKFPAEEINHEPNQIYRNYLKQMRFHSYISQQNLIKLLIHNSTNSLINQKSLTKQYFVIDKLIGKQEFEDLKYQLCCENYVLLKKVLEALEKGQYNIQDLKKKHLQQRKDKYTDFVFSRKENYWSNQTENRIKCAKKIRKSSNYLSISKKVLPIEIEGEFSGIKYQPVAFHETTLIAPEIKQQPLQGILNNLYVLCHGFQGSTKDLVLLRNIIKQFNPEGYYLLAKSYQNQFQANASILQMGQKLATQIIQFMKDENLSNTTTKVHFIGFSLGGIIARASLPHLQNIHFGRYTSISSPHLGCAGSETLVTLGLFMLKSILKYKCINQLCLSDNKLVQNSVMYKLSVQGSLNRFQQVALISNSKDTFVPWESARLQPIGGKIKKVEQNMISNMINNSCRLMIVHRLDFDSNEPKSSIYQAKERLEQVIGRSTHMQFVKNDVMIRMMLNTLSL